MTDNAKVQLTIRLPAALVQDLEARRAAAEAEAGFRMTMNEFLSDVIAIGNLVLKRLPNGEPARWRCVEPTSI